MTCRIGIGLLGKGSTNHLHHRRVVEAFRLAGARVTFLLREDYADIMQKIPGCDYVTLRFKLPANNWLLNFCADLRKMYPFYDKGRSVSLPPWWRLSIFGRFGLLIKKLLARYEWVVKICIRIEGKLFIPSSVQGVDPSGFDRLMLLGVGTASSEMEGIMTWWARFHGIKVFHYVGNYDNLSSKGFRGVPIDRLLAWGPSMKEDAIRLQGLQENYIDTIGSLRYNAIWSGPTLSKEAFFESAGLKPDRKTILYAGFVFEYHYFEMLEIYKQLLQQNVNCQLILRIYPNKTLLNTPYINALISYAESLPNVFVSIADPNFKQGSRDHEVLQIEENELVNSLRYCDVVINHYSTISIEACLFDKPAINMWYFQPPNRAWRDQPQCIDYPSLYHNRRLSSYKAVSLAFNRTDLIMLIKDAFNNPKRLAKERRNVVEKEIGVVDGKTLERMVSICTNGVRP
jgi:hypothetical protein